MITYLAKFCPGLADEVRPIRHLAQKDTSWTWNVKQDNALKKLIHLVSDAHVLRLYDPSIPVSRCFVVRTRSSAASRRSSCRICVPDTHCHAAIACTNRKRDASSSAGFGNVSSVRVRSGSRGGNRPQATVGYRIKRLAEVSPRLQRMRLRYLRYQFKLEYRPGKEMTLADTLSRTPTSTFFTGHDDRSEEQAAVVVHQAILHLWVVTGAERLLGRTQQCKPYDISWA